MFIIVKYTCRNRFIYTFVAGEHANYLILLTPHPSEYNTAQPTTNKPDTNPPTEQHHYNHTDDAPRDLSLTDARS